MNQLIPFPKRSLDSCETVAEVKNFLADIAAMVAWAKAQDDPHVEAAAIEWKMRAERKLGQLMAAQKAAGLMAPPPGLNQYSREEDRVFKKPEAPATLLEAGIDKNLAHRAREAAALPEAEFEDKIAERRDEIINKPFVVNNSGNNEWYTPPRFIEAARCVMGSIDCDPASSERANDIVKAAEFFTEQDDGLTKKWNGNVWMNPPYAQPLMAQFSEALASKFDLGEILQACVLVNNATETGWFRRLAISSNAICFTQSRIRFIDKSGNPSGAPLQGQAILYFGGSTDLFIREFQEFGFVYPMRPVCG